MAAPVAAILSSCTFDMYRCIYRWGCQCAVCYPL